MAKTVKVLELEIRRVQIPIVGVSPLVVHRFSEPIPDEDEDSKAQASKKPVEMTPRMKAEASKYISAEGWEGIKAAAFKSSIKRGAGVIGLVMKKIDMSVFVIPDCKETGYVRVYGEPSMRSDKVSFSNGKGAGYVHRTQYIEWNTTLTIEYNAGLITLQQVYQAIKAAGYSAGVGAMRPERTGLTFGKYDLAPTGS